MNKLHYKYKNQLEEQGKLLNIDIYHYKENQDVDILILKNPSKQKYAIYRCLWDNGFNPTKRDWVYNYVFLSKHISDKMAKDLKRH